MDCVASKRKMCELSVWVVGEAFFPPQWPAETDMSDKCRVAKHVLRSCQVLTIGQRCDDWFVLRRFRVTGTIASFLTMHKDDLRLSIGLTSQGSDEKSHQQLLSACADSWFTTARSTEAMMRGTANEEACVSALYKMYFVGDVCEVGMIALKVSPWIACSPDGIALIRVASIGFSGCVSDEEALESVEIKTSVSEISSSVTTQNASADVITCELGDEAFRKHVPEAHMAQVIQQMVVISILFAIYLRATETGFMFVLVIRASESFIDMWKRALLSVSTPLLQWAYTSVIGIELLDLEA
jgi:YqaJ-like viral recombinase domain